MKQYSHLPRELVEDWKQEVRQWDAGASPGRFHYHDVDEWLVVLEGEITFFTLGDKPFHLVADGVLRIPRGEVHRTHVGSDGVEYRMFIPTSVTPFATDLAESEIDLLGRQLLFPEYEDGREGAPGEFFEEALSDALVFCRADGTIVDKKTFLRGPFLDGGRSSSGTLRVLNKGAKGALISTIVNKTENGSTRSFTNVRFLAAEGGTLRCRMWINYPELAPE